MTTRNRFTPRRSPLALALLGAALGAPALPALAQDGALEEVVVTATRRETNLQDTGLSITAFSAQRLRDENVVRFDDVALQTPGLQFTSAGPSALVGLISIRGVAQNDFAAHLESANALYVDDVYRPSTNGNIQNLFDIERVEIIKGPQGTLFGRNATGGLIHVITAEPTDELEGYVDLGAGEYDLFTTEGVLNLPLGERAALRLAGNYRESDGWIENDAGPDNPQDATTALRAKLRLDPNDCLRIKLQGEYYEIDDVDTGGAFATGGFVGPDTLGRFRPERYTDTGYIDEDGDPFSGAFDFPGKMDREDKVFIADVEYRSGDWTYTSITGWQDQEIAYSEDNDLTPFDIAIFRQNTEQQSFTQELRVHGDLDRLRVTGGAFWLDIEGDYFQNYQINNLGNYNGIVAPIPLDLIPLGLNQAANYEIDSQSWSLFGQGEYDVSDSVTLTAGLRYTDDEKDYDYLNTCDNLIGFPACGPFDPSTLAGAGRVTDSGSENGWSARLQADWRLTDDLLLFASWNRGYKAFSYNAGFAGAAPVANVRFDGETIDAYEVGAKTDFWDGRARLNASAFYYDYQDYQAFDQRGVQFILTNTDATVYGADADLTLSPGWGIDITMGLALLDTEVEDIPIGGQFLERDAPQSPDLTYNFVVAKTVEMQAGSLRFGIDGSYTDTYYSQLTNAEVTEVGDYWLYNARVSFTSQDGRWEGAVAVRNLADEEALQYAFDITFPGNGLVEQVYAPPRWVSASVRFNF
jgi:iron complex outermembrane receptor protein